MEPPKKETFSRYDYHECEKYIEKKHGIELRDYAGKFKSGGSLDNPYHDFWHFVLDMESNIRNGSLFMMYEWWKDDAKEWQREIVDMFLDEFGEVDETGEKYIKFYVAW